jgi:hypothetical protein
LIAGQSMANKKAPPAKEMLKSNNWSENLFNYFLPLFIWSGGIFMPKFHVFI